jgi:uncharacterized protein
MKYIPLIFIALALMGFISSSAAQQTTLPPKQPSARAQIVAQAAQKQIGVTLYYDPSYVRLEYPSGDVPQDRGVCSDVIIRAFRAAGVDLQRLLHEDMRRNWSAYPKNWGLKRPDANIDHRRVANLEVFFARRGKKLGANQMLLPGDVVTWTLPSGQLHLGIITSKLEPTGKRPLVVHNIGNGAQLEDVLTAWAFRAHYRYFK